MGRPKKNIPIAAFVSRSPFALGKFGIQADPTKDYRWVTEKRISERKFNDGYELVTNDTAGTSDKTIRTKDNMALMVRSRDKADESAKAKHYETIRRESASREDFDERIERLSRKHDMNLHKNITNEEGDN